MIRSFWIQKRDVVAVGDRNKHWAGAQVPQRAEAIGKHVREQNILSEFLKLTYCAENDSF